MPNRKKKTKKEYVNHPRYGNKPKHSGLNASNEQILNAHWRYARESIFSESAILADTSKQNFSIYPITIYVDIEKQCIQCERWFIFFAEEQKYWYENLGFYVDADCVKCIDCRKKEQSVKHLMRQYEMLVKNDRRTENETTELKNIALELLQLGYITNKNKIDNIK